MSIWGLAFYSILILFGLLALEFLRQPQASELGFIATIGIGLLDLASRFNASEVLAITIAKLDHSANFALGIPSIVGFATILVPRAVFPSKPESMSERLTARLCRSGLIME